MKIMKNKRVLASILLVFVVLFVTVNTNTAKASNIIAVDSSYTSSVAATNYMFLNNGDLFMHNDTNFSILDGTTYLEKRTGSLNQQGTLSIQGQFANGNLIFGCWYGSKPYVVIKDFNTLGSLAMNLLVNGSGGAYSARLVGFDSSNNAVFCDYWANVFIFNNAGGLIKKSSGVYHTGSATMSPNKMDMILGMETGGRLSYIPLNTLNTTNTWESPQTSIVSWETDNPRYTLARQTVYALALSNTKSFLSAADYWEVVDTSRGYTYAQRLISYGYLEGGIQFFSLLEDGNMFISNQTKWKIVNISNGSLVQEGLLFNSIFARKGDKYLSITSGVLSVCSIQGTPTPPVVPVPDRMDAVEVLNSKYISVDGIRFRVLASRYAIADNAAAMGVDSWTLGAGNIRGLGNNKSYVIQARYMSISEWNTYKGIIGNPSVTMWLEDPGVYTFSYAGVQTTGVQTAFDPTTQLGVRPVLILDYAIVIRSGTGTYLDPYILESTYSTKGSNPIPVMTVVNGIAFSIGVTGVDTIPNASASGGVTVTNESLTDGYIKLTGTLTGLGFQTITINGIDFVFFKIAAPSGSTVTATFS